MIFYIALYVYNSGHLQWGQKQENLKYKIIFDYIHQGDKYVAQIFKKVIKIYTFKS